MEKFTLVGFLLRFLMALALVLVTFNPSGYSYIHWLANGFPKITPLEVVAGLALLVAWIVFVRATLASIGVLGVILTAVLFGAVCWLLASWGWLSVGSTSALAWLVLVMVSLVLTAGLSWAHIRRRLSGQATVDEVEER